jgi:DNA replication protein
MSGKDTPAAPFKGFSAGKHEHINIPTQFFSEVLPLMQDGAVLQVMLFCWRALHQQGGQVRYLVRDDFAHDATLKQTAPNLDEAIEKTVALGFLLRVDVPLGKDEADIVHSPSPDMDLPTETLYFVNTERGRQAVMQIAQGNWERHAQHITILPERPNIFRTYEANIGVLTPMIAEALRSAQEDYPHDWLEDAIRIAVESNARNWRYIEAILQRWQKEGRAKDATTEGHHQWHDERKSDGRNNAEKYGGGKYADFIES